MKTYKENDLVIYTDSEGKRYDTFVIFDTDELSGLTHINHYNLKVDLSSLVLHPRALKGNPIPMSDELSFNLFQQLKNKFIEKDINKNTNVAMIVYRNIDGEELAQAS